jgi:hypothetical protein
MLETLDLVKLCFSVVILSSFLEVLNGIGMGVDNLAYGNDLLENLSGDRSIS